MIVIELEHRLSESNFAEAEINFDFGCYFCALKEDLFILFHRIWGCGAFEIIPAEIEI